MQSLHHALVFINADRETVFAKTVGWLNDSKFKINLQNKNRIVAVYPGWHGFGLTDAQTTSELEILLQDTHGQTAVSVCHRTRQFFVLAGAMCGNILEREVNSLIAHLEQEK